jgi:hypothetical protein
VRHGRAGVNSGASHPPADGQVIADAVKITRRSAG